MISATRAMATIRKTTKRASYIINLFLADLPHTNASTNLAGFLFPTEAGVNTNQSEWPSQGQF
jgi:hypothetical protein